MEWKQLLDDTRIRKLDQAGETQRRSSSPDDRSEFQRDYDRSLFSTPVRRLQDKAQVFPLEPHDSVRTRLTHSLEVSNTARALAWSAAKWLKDTSKLVDRELLAAIPLVAATCGLIHDLGNPPFGHAGEVAMQDWFAKHRTEVNFTDVHMDDPRAAKQMANDFLKFEGNAQTIRIVSRLQLIKDYYGLNLTCAAMAAALKYTATSDESGLDPSDHPNYKPGYFRSEAGLVGRIRERTGTLGCRHPLTFLVEAADDICYSTVDIEDGVKKGVLSWGEAYAKIKEYSGSSELLETIMRDVDNYMNKEGGLELSRREADEANSQMFRTYGIGYMSRAVLESFKQNYDSIMSGDFRSELVKTSGAADLIGACKRVARELIFHKDRSIMEREIKGRNVIHSLMDLFWEGLRDYSPEQELDRKKHASKVVSLISDNYKRIFGLGLSRGFLPAKYLRLQLMADYVCGMTDSFATRLRDDLNA